jgi:5'-3' exonuclease
MQISSSHLQLSVKLAKLSQQAQRVTPAMVESSCRLLDLMGLPYYRHDAGDFEAESICAAMTDDGITAASLSEDMDTVCAAVP